MKTIYMYVCLLYAGTMEVNGTTDPAACRPANKSSDRRQNARLWTDCFRRQLWLFGWRSVVINIFYGLMHYCPFSMIHCMSCEYCRCYSSKQVERMASVSTQALSTSVISESDNADLQSSMSSTPLNARQSQTLNSIIVQALAIKPSKFHQPF